MSAERAQGEEVIARLRPHGRVLLWPSVALIVVVSCAAYFFGRFPQVWENLGILGLAALLVLLLWVIPVIAWLGRNYTITTRRLILRNGFVVRVRRELLYSRAYDVTVRKTGLQSVFGSGDVEVNSGNEKPVTLRDVPNANLVQAALHDLIEASQNPGPVRPGAAPDETTIWGTR